MQKTTTTGMPKTSMPAGLLAQETNLSALCSRGAPGGLLPSSTSEARRVADLLNVTDSDVLHLCHSLTARMHANAARPPRIHASCAVVGSAGGLRGAALGTRIDAHDAIFRINLAPTRQHEGDVGRRTTYRVATHTVWRTLIANERPSLTPSTATFLYCHNMWIGTCHRDCAKGLATAPSNSRKRPVRPALISPSLVAYTMDAMGEDHMRSFRRKRVYQKPPSSGLVAVALARSLCRHVSIFGFGNSSGGGGTCEYYFGPTCRRNESVYFRERSHDWHSQWRLLVRMLERGEISGGSRGAALTP